jgi:hypothetical protein
MAKAVHSPEIRADYHDHIPLDRYGLEEELAEAVFCAAIARAILPDKFWPWTAVLRPPESDCRLCVASDETVEVVICIEARGHPVPSAGISGRKALRAPFCNHFRIRGRDCWLGY